MSQDQTDISRRSFTRLAAATAVAASAPTSATARPQANGKLRVRYDIAKLPLTHPVLKAYAAGVEEMKRRPPAVRTSWRFQASIHETACPHGNWYFLPWHRAYILYFEEICRAASKYDDFALPYWDWSRTPRVPRAFWDRSSPLYHAKRQVTANSQANLEMVGPEKLDEIAGTADFITFAGGLAKPDRYQRPSSRGLLEGTPHNYIHRFVGTGDNPNLPPEQFGDMVTLLSPLDPVFWPHHANVDRVWARAASRTTTEADFNNGKFKFFRPDGSDIEVKVADLLDHRSLGYRYESEPERIFFTTMSSPVRASAGPGLTVGAAVPAAVGQSAPQTATVAVTPALRERLDKAGRANPEAARETTFRLTVENVRPPAGGNFLVRVFLNTPGAAAGTSIESAGYVGAFTFFGHEGGAHHSNDEAGGFVLDATRAVRRLQEDGLYTPGGPLTVTLVTVPLAQAVGAAGAGSAKIGELKVGGFKLEAIE